MTRGWIEEAGEVSEDAKKNLWISIGRWKNEIYGLKKKATNHLQSKERISISGVL